VKEGGGIWLKHGGQLKSWRMVGRSGAADGDNGEEDENHIYSPKSTPLRRQLVSKRDGGKPIGFQCFKQLFWLYILLSCLPLTEYKSMTFNLI
jgi:hypothetical protein